MNRFKISAIFLEPGAQRGFDCRKSQVSRPPMSNSHPQVHTAARRNVRLYPWYSFLRNLLFWQATWFLFFQNHLSAAEAILLYAIYDVATTVLEVPSGYMSDRLGRRTTLILSATATLLAAMLFSVGSGLAVYRRPRAVGSGG